MIIIFQRTIPPWIFQNYMTEVEMDSNCTLTVVARFCPGLVVLSAKCSYLLRAYTSTNRACMTLDPYAFQSTSWGHSCTYGPLISTNYYTQEQILRKMSWCSVQVVYLKVVVGAV